MTTDIARYQGFATAVADLLCEVTPDGRVGFVGGFGPTLGLVAGASFYDAFVEDAGQLLSSLLAGTTSSRRNGPLTVMLERPADGRRIATISTFRHPDVAPSLCCAITFFDQPPGARMLDADALVAAATVPREARASVSLIEIDQLSAALRAMSGSSAVQLIHQLEEALAEASVDQRSVACLGGDRYAVVHAEHERAAVLDSIRIAGARNGVALAPFAENLAMPDDDSMVVACALRSTLDRFISGGLSPDGTLRQHFAQAVGDTRARVAGFMSLVREQRVKLHFQPIVDLRSGTVHHHEVLARFGHNNDTEGMIRTAEDLRLITRFDIAVAERAVARLRQDAASGLRLAVNVSSKSLEADNYGLALLTMTATAPDIRKRLFLEVTETAAITDLTPVAKRIGQLRDSGFRIYIDDFGSGAASLDYIRAFPVDAVKIDGKFVRESHRDPRAVMMVRHIVQLCTSLGLDTVAEQIETQEIAELMADCGVGYGQGWLWGRAEAQPLMSIARPLLAAAG